MSQLPKTLYETYDRILMRVNQQTIQLVRRTLQWIAYAKPTPDPKQLAEIVSFGEDDEELEPDACPDPNDLLRFCGSLIRQVDGFFELAHFTVQEFLEAIVPGDDRLGKFRLSPTPGTVNLV